MTVSGSRLCFLVSFTKERKQETARRTQETGNETMWKRVLYRNVLRALDRKQNRKRPDICRFLGTRSETSICFLLRSPTTNAELWYERIDR